MSEMRTPNTNVVTNPFIMCAASILTVTVPDSPRAQVDLVAAADERGRSIFSSANDGGSGDDGGGGGGDGGEQTHTGARQAPVLPSLSNTRTDPPSLLHYHIPQHTAP